MDQISHKRWKVEGYYTFSYQTFKWNFHSEYLPGEEIIWEFGDGKLTCLVDGRHEHTVPFGIHEDEEGDEVLVIDFSGLVPPLYTRCVEKYLIDERHDGDVWLYHYGTKNHTGFWLAILLTKA